VPNIKSAKKRVLTTERNRLRNQAYKSAIRTAVKKVLEVTPKAKAADVRPHLDKAYSLIDRAVLKGILHKNTAARYKSRLTKAFAKKLAA
jgi:small subunit ribosomal protein S20